MPSFSTRMIWSCVCALAVGAAPASHAAPLHPGPQPLPLPPAVPAPQDRPFPGAMSVWVDATDTTHHVLSVHEWIPVPQEARRKGEMILLYPQWLPGDHSPSGTIDQLGGLVVKVEGRIQPWRRDPVNVFAFHVPVSAMTPMLEINFQLLTPVTPRQGRVVMTPSIVNVQWNAVSLYPAGYFTRNIPVRASVRVPHGWRIASAMKGEPHGEETIFEPTTYNVLVDSPLFAGRYVYRWALNDAKQAPVWLNVVADEPRALHATQEQIAAHRALVRQALSLFGAAHYRHYDFLLALTDELGGIGLEHHQSSENTASPGYFTAWNETFPERDLLAHEYTHSWNGKYRRPADLWAADFNTPQRGSLLWVYEGQTQYWGNVLAARSGLVTKEQGLDALAWSAAVYDHVAGRLWRPLEDTTDDPVIAQRGPLAWRDWQRSEDYYTEGQLLWLDVDVLIRTLSKDKASLDDFARRFFGGKDGDVVTSTYRFEDVVRVLNDVQPYDWATFLRAHLEEVTPHAPLEWLKASGYRLTYTAQPSPYVLAMQNERHTVDLTFSLGMVVSATGKVALVHWNRPAFQAGFAAGQEIVAVNGMSFTPERLLRAVVDAQASLAQDVQCVVKEGEHVRTLSIPYHDGLRYPHLERVKGTTDRLGSIYSPR